MEDRERGKVLSRREALALLGAAGAAAVARPADLVAWARAPETPPAPGRCVVRPEQTEGPFFFDQDLQRADIRLDPTDGEVRPGAQLDIAFHVTQLSDGACRDLAGARVDLWQCDALGVYSGVLSPGEDSTGKKFLRGYQITDQQGLVRFTTIYPGWYRGRTVHIHFKIRTGAGGRTGLEFTSQLYFDDELTDAVHARPPYAAKGARRTRNLSDGIFRRGGSQLLLDATRRDPGFAAAFEIALQM